jgi:hypothetical protein
MDPHDGRLLVEADTGNRFSPLLPEISAQMESFAKSIQEAVEQKTHRAIANLQVHIHANRIILLGRCTTYYMKQLAQHAAMIAGGRNFVIHNLIEVQVS